MRIKHLALTETDNKHFIYLGSGANFDIDFYMRKKMHTSIKKDLKLPLFANRLFSSTLTTGLLLFFFWAAAHIIDNTKLFADFGIFFYTCCGLSVLLFFGQDRLLHMIMHDCSEKTALAKAYLHFVFIQIGIYLLMFFIGSIVLLNMHDLRDHPIILSLALFPYVNILETGSNMLRALEKPFLAQSFWSFNLCIFLALSMAIFDEHTATGLRHYAILLSFFCIVFGITATLWSLKYFKKFVGNDVNIFQHCLNPKHWHIKTECVFYRSWLKKGTHLFLDTLINVIEDFATPVMLLLHISAKGIAAYVVIDAMIAFQYSLYIVMKNHLFPMVLPLLSQYKNQYVTLNANRTYQRMCLLQWIALIAVTICIALIGPAVLSTYGTGYLDYYPLLLLGLAIYFPIYGCALINVVMLRMTLLRSYFKQYQFARLCLVLIAMFALTMLAGAYGMLIGIGLPSVLLTVCCAWRIKKSTGLNIYSPWWDSNKKRPSTI